MDIERIARSCALRASEEKAAKLSPGRAADGNGVLIYARWVAKRAVELAAGEIKQAAYAEGFRDGHAERNERAVMEAQQLQHEVTR